MTLEAPQTAEDFYTIPLKTPQELHALGCVFRDDVWLFPVAWYDRIPNDFPLITLQGENISFKRGATPKTDIGSGALPYGTPRLEADSLGNFCVCDGDSVSKLVQDYHDKGIPVVDTTVGEQKGRRGSNDRIIVAPPVDLESLRYKTPEEILALGCGGYERHGKVIWLYPEEWLSAIPEGYVVVTTGGETRRFSMHAPISPEMDGTGFLPFGFLSA